MDVTWRIDHRPARRLLICPRQWVLLIWARVARLKAVKINWIWWGFFWKWKLLSCVRLFATPRTCPWNSPDKNPGVGSLSLLQGIFPTQGSNSGLLHCRWILYQLSHKGSPGTLEWVAYPFSRGSSWPRKWTGVSCIAGGFFINWAIREALPPLNTCQFFDVCFSDDFCMCVYILGYKSLPDQYQFKYLFLNGTVSLNDFT